MGCTSSQAIPVQSQTPNGLQGANGLVNSAMTDDATKRRYNKNNNDNDNDNNNHSSKTPSASIQSGRINNNNNTNNDGSTIGDDTGQTGDPDDARGPSRSTDNWMDINSDLLREYSLVEMEIKDIESRDVYHIYRDQIEKLERLQQELDMIGREIDAIEPPGFDDISSVKSNTNNHSNQSNHKADTSRRSHASHRTRDLDTGSHNKRIEDLFSRKAVLEKEFDQLKQDLEATIAECDNLQQKHLKRDAILDKIFDGNYGSGLENHLEKQLDWLLEQKYYVDQVYYAWKRAETLSSQACEQFLLALEEFKRLPSIQDKNERREVAGSIHDLLIKARFDMSQAQKYNPNVDAPFYTTEETERFDRSVEAVLSEDELSVARYNQIITVIEIAYKRAVSIKLWLEQILQTTIARDSFELAEEYRWIAIQLRKERINLIQGQLQESSLMNSITSGKGDGTTALPQEINRDSGVESETNEIDLNEQMNRFLEDQDQVVGNESMRNGARDNSTGTKNDNNRVNVNERDEGAKTNQQKQQTSTTVEVNNNSNNSAALPTALASGDLGATQAAPRTTIRHRPDELMGHSTMGTDGSPAPGASSRLLVDVNEELRRAVLAQVGQTHERHRSVLERHQQETQAKASYILDKKLQERQRRREGLLGRTAAASN
ncbi:hypothetical protein GZH46_00073 [Fragariocoptes setiger]|uniref:Uncharacterized protein n=1 Tax=Fragariocoptes setiger TaxID=1670756 RepID=A0ABQ7SDA3_9ACAR|nr:hypothetical protein GZH46_00073 [Fragariocoptes setiger]